MTPDRFAQLKPILGEQIVPLQLAYAVSDEAGRKDISFLLELLSAKAALGITPPPQAISSGKYPLGTVLNGLVRQHPFALRDVDWFHLGVFGMTGRGKTNTVIHLLNSLNTQGKNWLVFDWKRSGYRDLMKQNPDLLVFTVGRDISPFFFNPLLPPSGVETIPWIKQFIGCLSHAYFLGHGCEMILQDVLHPTRTPTLRDVLETLQIYPAKWRKLYWLQSTERAIKALCYGGIDKVFNSDAHIPIDKLLNQNVVFELDALSDSEAKFFVEILMSAIYLYRKEHRHCGFQHVSVIEEAHNVLKKEGIDKESKSIMDKLFREIREYGESLIVVDQMPAEILGAAIANTSTQITHSLKRREDTQTVSRSMLLSNHEEMILGRLPIGHAVVKLQNRWHAPFIVAIPKVPVESGIVTDEEITHQMGSFFAQRWLKLPQPSKSDVISPLSLTDKREQTIPKKGKQGIDTEELMLLKDIVKYPLLPTTKRYQRLKLNPRRGNQINDGLRKKRLIQEVPIATANSQIKLLQLTQAGLARVDPKGSHLQPNPSLSHQYWTHHIKTVLEENSYTVFVEHQLKTGGVVDLFAIKEKQAIAIEVETGKSDILANLKKCLQAAPQRIIFAATTPQAKTRIETQLRQVKLNPNSRLLIIEARYFARLDI